MSANATADKPIIVTFFPDKYASAKHEESLTPTQLAQCISTTSGPDQDHLPLLKLGRFSGNPTEKGSLRHNAALLAISGIAGEHDAGHVTLDEALRLSREAGICAVGYTTRNHTKAKPRWRLLCPFSKEYPPTDHARFLERLNGILKGALTPECWNLSLSYFYGRVGAHNPDYCVALVQGGCLDLRDDLDVFAIGKPPSPRRSKRTVGNGGNGKGNGTQPPRSKPTGDRPSVGTISDNPRGIAIIDELLAALSATPDGEKHDRLLREGRLFGGYLHHTTLTEGAAADILVAALPPSAEDLDAARKTALDGLRMGVQAPLTAPSTDGSEFTPVDGDDEPKSSPGPLRPRWDPWGDPPPPVWPGGILSPQIEAALISIAARDGLDPGLLCTTALAGVSAAAHKAIRFIPYQPGTEGEQGLWSVPPIVWIVAVANSGFRKSCYDEIIFAAIWDREKEEWRIYQSMHDTWEATPKGASRGPEPKAPPDYIITDFTPEGLRDALHGSGRGTALVVDELVSLLEFDRYRGRAGGANAGRGWLLSTFDDKPQRVVRADKKGKVLIEHTGCAMFGGIQRGRIAALKGDLETDGFLQRMCTIMVPPSAGSRPGTVINSGMDRFVAAIERLCTFDPRTYTTTPDGSACIKSTEDIAKDYAGISDYGEGWPGFAYKLHGLHARFALLLHLLENPTADIIPTGRVERAHRLTHKFILQHARDFHGELLGSAGDTHRDIAGWLLTRGPSRPGKPERIVASDLTNNVRSCRSLGSKGIGEVLDRFVTNGWLTPETNYPSNRAWLFDPNIRNQFAARVQTERDRRAVVRDLIQRMAQDRTGSTTT